MVFQNILICSGYSKVSHTDTVLMKIILQWDERGLKKKKPWVWWEFKACEQHHKSIFGTEMSWLEDEQLFACENIYGLYSSWGCAQGTTTMRMVLV